MMTSFIFYIDAFSYLQQLSSESQLQHLHYYWYVNATPNYSRPEADIIEDI